MVNNGPRCIGQPFQVTG